MGRMERTKPNFFARQSLTFSSSALKKKNGSSHKRWLRDRETILTRRSRHLALLHKIALFKSGGTTTSECRRAKVKSAAAVP